MHEPITKGKVSEQCLLASTDCKILACSRLSCASKMLFCNFCMISHAEISSCEEDGCGGIKGEIKCGLHPIWSWKGMKPVVALMVFMMWKEICGRAQDYPCWFCLTWYRKHWFTVLFVCSLMPLVWGWYAVDNIGFTPVSLWSAFQNFEMNSLSLSETMSVGKLFLQYHLSKKNIGQLLCINIHVCWHQLNVTSKVVCKGDDTVVTIIFW